jgi:hypothetical protein
MGRQSAIRLALRLALVLAAPAYAFAAYVTSTAPFGQSTANPPNFVGRTINVMDFGAQCDAVTGNGQMAQFGHTLVAGGTFQFNAATDKNKPITVSGAGDWTLNGFVNTGSQVVFNVRYVAPDNSLHPSLIGAAGGAIIDGDTAGAINGLTISTEHWGTPDTGTYGLTTTGTWSSGLMVTTMTLMAGSAPLVGQNGQFVQVASGPPDYGTFSPHTLQPQVGMVVNSASGDISNDAITAVSISGTTLTLASPLPSAGGNETVTISGKDSPYVIYLTTAAMGSTSGLDTFTIPGAPLTGFIGTVTPPYTVTITKAVGGAFVSAAAPVPGWVATKVNGIVLGVAGSGYHVGDFLTLTDSLVGTKLQVLGTTGTTNSVAGANVYAQAPIIATSDPSGQYFQTTDPSSKGGSGAEFDVQFSRTGKFWYGTDDSSAINLALSGAFSATPNTIGSTSSSPTIVVQATVMGSPSIVTGLVDGMSISGAGIAPNTWIVNFSQNISLNETTITLSQLASVGAGVPITITGPQTQGSDIWLPANRNCGVTSSINLPNGNTSLRGWDWSGSGIVALAPMPTDANGYSYVVGLPVVYPEGGGMRDIRVDANKLSQFTCGIEGGEDQFYGNVQCENAITSEWLCGYPGVNTNQISGTVFHHIRGITPFVEYGPVSLLPAENYLAANGCSAEQVDNSYFRSGIVNILDNQSHFNAYLGNVEDSIEPFNSQYCVELTGHQLLGNNRCDDASVAGIYLTGGNSIVHDSVDTWNNAWPWGPTVYGQTYGVLIGPNVSGSLIDGVTAGGVSSSADIVFQQGTPSSSTIVVNSPGASLVLPGPGYGIPNPQGRLTLQTGSPVMTGNVSGASTIYYDCYTGQNVPYFNGGTDSLDAIPLCEVNAALNTSTEFINDIFDVWWWHNAGSPVLCVATNGSGKGWSGDGGSLSSRGTGYTQVSATPRGYLTNTNAFNVTSAHCFNGTTDYLTSAPGGVIPANQLTWLGSFYTNVAGGTSFIPQPASAIGGANAIIGIWNGYNRVPVSAVEQDSATAYGVAMSGTWEIADAHNSGKNNIEVVDGNQQTPFDLLLTQVVNNSPIPAANPQLSIADVTTTTLCPSTSAPLTFTSQQSTSPISVAYKLSKPPLLGLHCAQALEKAVNTSFVFNSNSALTLSLNWQY